MGFGYDLSDSIIPKMDLGSEEIGFIFCDKHPLHVTGIQVSDPGPRALLLNSHKTGFDSRRQYFFQLKQFFFYLGLLII